MKSLPPDQRQAIEMAFFGGMTHVEIAGALNEPLGTVKARIRREMLKLRKSLQAYTDQRRTTGTSQALRGRRAG